MKTEKTVIKSSRFKAIIESRSYHRFLKLTTCIFLLFTIPFLAITETITFSADSMSGSASDKNEYTLLSGNAYIKTDSMELTADIIELKGTDYRYIEAKGNVNGTYTDGGFTFTCSTINYDRETEIAVLEDKVSMDDTENDVQLEAEFIEYDQITETAIIQIAVKIVKDESLCTSAFALYRKELQILELSGSPKIVQGDDIFQAQEIIFNLETEEITLDGKVRGTVGDKKEDTSQTETDSEQQTVDTTEEQTEEQTEDTTEEQAGSMTDDTATEKITTEEQANE